MSIVSKLAAALVGAPPLSVPPGPSATLAGTLPTAKPEDVGMSSERLARMGPAVQRHIDAGEIAGVVTLVARRGQIVHFEAYGYSDIAKRTPMRTDNIFGLASSSKPITAVAIMMLVESGDIRLTDPVSRYIPEFEAAAQVAVPKPGGAEGAYDLVPATRPITVARPLDARLGAHERRAGCNAPRARPRNARRRTRSRPTSRSSAPCRSISSPARCGATAGSRASTCCRASSRSRRSSRTTSSCASASSSRSTCRTRRSTHGPASRARRDVHARRDGKLESTPRDLSHVCISRAPAVSSASVEDYLQFAQMLLNRGELDGQRLLGPRTVELMTSNHTGDMVNGQFGRPARGMGFGLGMQVVLDPIAADLAVSKGAISWPGGSGVAHWIEPAEELVSIYFIQGGQGGPRAQAFENAVRQAIID